ncbi:hypothetical protein [Lysinibacillus pakistanensis]
MEELGLSQILSDEQMNALENEEGKELARRFYRDYIEYVHHGQSVK